MAERNEPPEKLVGALVAGLKVLRYLSRTDAPVGVSQVARDLDLNPSTCFNLLRTLVHENLVGFDPARKSYSVGLGMLELTKGLLEQDRVVRLLHPRLEAIAQAHRVTATLWKRFGERVVLVDRAESDSAVRVHMTLGQRLPMLVAALGRAMAAHAGLKREELRRRFNALRWENPPDFDSYWGDVEAVRRDGYAVDRDNFVRGVTTASAPILDGDGAPVMALSAVGFSGQFSDGSLGALGLALAQHAREIGLALVGSARSEAPVPAPRLRAVRG